MRHRLRTVFASLPEGMKERLRATRADVDHLGLRLRRFGASGVRRLHVGAAVAHPHPFPEGVVSITFDDDLVDAFTKARPLMDAYGWGGTGYLLAYTVGDGLTIEQLHRLEDVHGWEIAGHGLARHVDLTTLTDAEVVVEVRGTRRWLAEHGFRGQRHFAYPYSANDRSVRAVVAEYFETARVVMGGAGNGLPPERSRLHRLGAFTWGAGFSTVASLTRQLDRTRRTAGWAVLVFHTLDGDDGFSVTSQDFAAILAHIDRLGMAVVPVGDVMRAWDTT